MPYCIYLRKSRADAEAELAGEGETLARHEKSLLALAKRQKLPITKIYREIVSGETIAARPVMQELLQAIEARQWEGVLVMEVERLARGDTMDQGVILNAFKYSDTKIITPAKTYDPNNEFDEEYFEFGLFMSRREYKTILRRMQRGREASVSEGKYVGSIPPYGYTRVKLPKEKGYTLAVVPEEAAAVKLAFELYAYGEVQEDGTIREIGRPSIAKRFSDMGLKNRKGAAWATSSVTRMLQNPVYAGNVVWKYRQEKKTTENGKIKITRPVNPDFLCVKGLHEPIVSPELWEAVQEKMKKSATSPLPPKSAMKNPLSGLVRCSFCGNLMQRRPYQKSSQPATLICATHNCPQISAPLYMVERRILEALEEWAEQHNATWDTAAPQNFAAKTDLLETSLQSAEKELELLEKQFEKTFELLETGVYSAEVFTQRNEMLSRKISEAKTTIAGIKKEIAALQKTQMEQTSFFPKIRALLETYDSLPPAAQNRRLKEILDHVEYHKTVNGRWHNSPDSFEIQLFPAISKDF